MINYKSISILLIVFYSTNLSFGADKYNDENRPYEFGFTIDGEQHRHEKKDENGIIMGEFGFITADGVYHVTVYATDENGRFKILSMKNIRVKPYPTASGQTKAGLTSRTSHSLSLNSENVPSPTTTTTSTTPAPAQPVQQLRTSLLPEQNGELRSVNQNTEFKKQSLEITRPPASPARSCSHCSLPTTTTIAPKIPEVFSQPNLGNQSSYSPSGYNNQNNNDNKYNSNTYNNYKNNNYNNNNGVQNQYQSNTNDQQSNNNKLPTGLFIQDNVENISPGEIMVPNKDLDTPYPARNPLNYEQNGNDGNQAINMQTYGNVAHNNINKYPQQNKNSYDRVIGSEVPDEEIRNIGQPGSQNLNPTGNYQPDLGQSNVGLFNTQNQMLNTPTNDNEQAIEKADSQAQQGFPQQESSLQNSPGKPLGDRTPKRYEPPSTLGAINGLSDKNLNYDTSNLGPGKSPKLISAQMQIVDKNTDIYHKNPGESDGLPNGVTKDYMMRVLYVFNYTVGFHGHYEKGFADGSKQGYYYVTGRNGVRTRVDYEADEKGFRPKITQEVLDLLSEDVPKPETEKEPKYGLKSYEFRWIYFPEETKTRQ